MKRLKLSDHALGMLIARYRAVLKKMFGLNCGFVLSPGLRRMIGGVAVAALVAVPGVALATDYHVGPGQTYVSLEDLRSRAVGFNDNDKVILYASDSSLETAFDFGGKTVTIEAAPGQNVTLTPKSGSTIQLAKMQIP